MYLKYIYSYKVLFFYVATGILYDQELIEK